MLWHQTKTRNWGLIAAICLLTITLGVFAEPVEIKLADGTLWHGEIGGPISLFEKKRNNTKHIEGTLTRDAGQFIVISTATGNSVVFISDIYSIEPGSEPPATEQATLKAPDQSKTPDVAKPAVQAGKLSKRVFRLPLDGGVGEIIRLTEIREIAEHADEFGPGQIIILDINSPGGSVLTGVQLKELVFDIRKRHRVIAWVDMAISGGAFLAFCCDEIYFRQSANLGSITMWSGNLKGAEEREMNAWIKQLEGVLAKTSRTPLFAGPMVIVARQLSYDIDSETGEITYYDDLTGEHILSDGTSVEVLALTAKNAEQCGLSDGTADTMEELTALLDLDSVDDDGFGITIAEKWAKLHKQAEVDIPELFREFQGDVEFRSQGERIMKQIKAGKQLISWASRLGESAGNFRLGPQIEFAPNPLDAIKRGIKELEQARQRL